MRRKQQHEEKQRHKQKKKERQRAGVAAAGLEALKRKVQSEALFGKREFVYQYGSSEEKLSEVLLRFVEPYRQVASTREACERLIAIGMVAWNAALVSKEQGQALVDDTVKSVQKSAGKEDAEVLRDVLNELIKRKERHFAADHRLVVSYQLTEQGGALHLTVASTPLQSPAEDAPTG